jgi:hypothetical protein
MIVDYFVRGGIPGFKELRGVQSASVHFATIVAFILLARRYTRGIIRREPRWYSGFVFYLTAALTFGIHLTLTRYSNEYNWLFSIGEMVGTTAAYTIIPVAVVAIFWRRMSIRDTTSAWAFFCVIMACLTITAWGQLISTPIADLGWWMFKYPATAANLSWTFCRNWGLVILMVRILAGKERLRMSGGEA